MDCSKGPTTHANLVEGDQSTAKHLLLSRNVRTGASIFLDVCRANVTIKGGKDDVVQVAIDLDGVPPNATARDYVEFLAVTEKRVDVRLNFPKRPKATVRIMVPATTTATVVNLTHGELRFETEDIAGDREINVVAGHVNILGNADAYRTLNAKILLGNLHDHRPPRQNAVGTVSKSLSGTGKGTIQINVVKGSVDLSPWD